MIGVDGPIVVQAPMQRRLLALFLASAGGPITLEWAGDQMWDGDPPRTARKTLLVYIHRLRLALGADAVSQQPSGYVLQLPHGAVDAYRFEELALQSNAAKKRGDLEAASALAAQGLAQWRGPSYADILDVQAVVAEAKRLDNYRLDVIEDWAELELALGRHVELVNALAGPCAEHPYRERLQGLQMLALYRSGRQAEALSVYRRTQRALAAELGIEPTRELMRMHQQMLNNDPALGPAPSFGPDTIAERRFLPRDIPDFTGRAADISRLDELASGSAEKSAAIIVSAIAGAGKTALAVHWAHRVAHRFPDGQFHVDLRGYDARNPMSPIEALARLLRAIGVADERIPHDVDEMSALYRATLANKKALILLDNARSADQVRPLLPASPGCLVVVTSRDALAGLIARDGARRLTLETLPAVDAVDLLAAILGPDRVRSEWDSAHQLVELCGHLPLALRVAAANLAAAISTTQAGQSIRSYVAELSHSNRMATLRVDGDLHSDVPAVFDHSYRVLSAPQRRLFRLLGLVPGQDFAAETVCALTGVAVDECRSILADLAEAHLVSLDTRSRGTLHDLIREYARQLAWDEEPSGECQGAIAGLLDWYVKATATASDAINKFRTPVTLTFPEPAAPLPDVSGLGAALAWLDTEYPNIVAAIRLAATPKRMPAHAVQLAHLLQPYFKRRNLTGDWIALMELAKQAAAELDDASALAHTITDLGYAHEIAGKTVVALDLQTEALRLHRQLGQRYGEALTLHRLGTVTFRLGRHAEAAEHHGNAAELFRELGDHVREAQCLSSLSVDLHLLDRQEEALAHAHKALDLEIRIGGGNEAALRTNLGRMYAQLGRHAEAIEQTRAALKLHRKSGSVNGEAVALPNLSYSYSRLGHHAEAIETALQGVERAQLCAFPETVAESLNTLAEAYSFAGDDEAALRRHSEALSIARSIGDADEQDRAEKGIAKARRVVRAELSTGRV